MLQSQERQCYRTNAGGVMAKAPGLSGCLLQPLNAAVPFEARIPGPAMTILLGVPAVSGRPSAKQPLNPMLAGNLKMNDKSKANEKATIAPNLHPLNSRELIAPVAGGWGTPRRTSLPGISLPSSNRLGMAASVMHPYFKPKWAVLPMDSCQMYVGGTKKASFGLRLHTHILPPLPR